MKMANPQPTKEEYGSLIYKLATLECELDQARMLLEATAKGGWWRRFWDMRSKGAVGALVIFVTVLILPNISLAVNDLAEILKGLPGVGVDVSYNINTKDRNWSDVTKEQIQTEVELRLRRAGIRVINKQDLEEGKPDLELTFWVGESLPKYYFVIVGAGLREEILTVRKLKVNGKLITNTWQTKKDTYTYSGNIKTKDVLDIIDNIVDQFINDYLAVNPK